ncbi:MAG: hypothetical protein U0T36_12860 [Saprospiraceae bacterium]
MKNFFILLLFLIALQVQSQTVSTKNWTLIHERTASWCPYCGTWGWDMKDRILTEFADEEVIFMAVHHSGDLTNPVAQQFGDNFGGFGQPIFFVDGVNINASSNNIGTKIEETQFELDFKRDQSVFAGVGLKAVLDETTQTLVADTKIEFFTDAEGGDYYLGLYTLEDIQNVQASRTGIQTHKNVLKNSILPNVFNNPLHNGAVTVGTKFSRTDTLKNVTVSADKLKVVGIIWTKVNGKYLFFNANIVPVTGIKSATNDINNAIDFSAYQSESGNIIVNFDPNTSLSGNVIVTDLTGNTITSTNTNTAVNGRLTLNGNFVSGIHIITYNAGKQVVSKKITLL